jgi:hypothetical protein
MNTTTNHEEAARHDNASTENSRDPNAATDKTARAIDDLLASAVGLGTVWVRYGLEVGRLALRTQSAWMKGVSQLLEHVADAIETPKTAAHSESDTDARN